MRHKGILRISIFIFIIFLFYQNNVYAKDKTLKIMVGESKVIKVQYAIKKSAIGDPDIADVTMVSEQEILINGKNSGTTSLLVWSKSDQREQYYIEVSRSLLTKPLIQLQVQVIEARVSSLQKLGIQWIDTLSFGEESIPGVFDLGTVERMTKLTASLNLLLREGDARILAKPNLVAVSGGKAEFQVGGEIPYLVPQQDTRTTIEWKKYGINLKINPVGDEKKGIISTGITVELSLLDYENAVRMEGYLMPALTNRIASTEVQVYAGTTIVIAGLKQTIEQKSEHKVPILGDIPLLKYFFKVKDANKGDTEVTVFITPTFLVPNKKSEN